MRSVGLAAAVTATGIAIAVPIAWLTTRTDLPGARAWATLATLPLVIPSYIGAYLFVSALGPSGALQDLLEPLGVERLPSIYGFGGAWLVLTLFTYPVILLTVRAALARLDPQLEEAARAMGRTPLETFRTIVVPQLRPAIAAGGLLVALYVLSDFGAVSIMRFNSFTREIYITFTAGFDRTGAAALAVLLVAVTLAVLFLYSRARSRLHLHRASPGTARPVRPVPLGRWRWPALGFCAARRLRSRWSCPSASSSTGRSRASATTPASAGWRSTPGTRSPPAGSRRLVAAAARDRRSPCSSCAARAGSRARSSGSATRATRCRGSSSPWPSSSSASAWRPPLYQSFAMLVIALTAHFLPLAIGAIGAALLQISPAGGGGGARARARPARGLPDDHRAARAGRDRRRRGARLPPRRQGAARDPDPRPDRVRDARHRHLAADDDRVLRGRRRARRSYCSPSRPRPSTF